MNIILETSRLTLRQFTEDDVDPGAHHPVPGSRLIDGAEHGEVEYALAKPEWQARTAGDAHCA